MPSSGKFWIYIIVSFFIVAFGQPARSSCAGFLAAACGYALFWSAMLLHPHRKGRFFLSFGWYAAVQAVQLSWMTSIQYMGFFMVFVYAGLLIWLGMQFGLLSIMLRPKQALSFLQCLAFAGFWVLLEWARIFLLTGFTWNPSGLALAGGCDTIQLASVFGIYGLSFWVMLTNFAALNWLVYRGARFALWVIVWAGLVLFPHCFGKIRRGFVEAQCSSVEQMTVALVETGLFVEQKWRNVQNSEMYIPPLRQWELGWRSLQKDAKVDLIVFPEGAFPYSVDAPYIYLEELQEMWNRHFGEDASINDFPPLEPPYAYAENWKGETYWLVTNAFLSQSLANHFHASVIIGLHADEEDLRYNSAFLFAPGNMHLERYDKRILVPVGEYIPMQSVRWLSHWLSKRFGVESSFAAGNQTNILGSADFPIGVAICLEETYSGLVRGFRTQGAKLLVGLSNDVWFPFSRLPQQHFDHGKVRAVENGLAFLRSSNMGITGGVDLFGNPLGMLLHSEEGAKVVYLSVPLSNCSTLYTLWGDHAILCASLIFCVSALVLSGKDCMRLKS